MSKTTYTTGEVAEFLGVHVKTVYKWCVQGKITAHKTSPIGRWRITKETLIEYAKDNGIPLEEEEESN